MNEYYVYFLRCEDGSLYAGLTTDPARRLKHHRGGRKKGGAKYTAAHGAVCFAALWRAPNRHAAYAMEYQMKQLSRKEKLARILGREDVSLRKQGFFRAPFPE